MNTLKIARKFHQQGWALIWLRPRSKQPVESGWTTGPRHDWSELEKSYRHGYNLGVRLGTPSCIDGRYLACFDVDIRGPEWRGVAENMLDSVLAGCGVDRKDLPRVVSGKGYGSGHYYFLTDRPFKQITYGKAKDSWEVVAYSDGRQMVLPPSIHPETGAQYQWMRGLPRVPPVLALDTEVSSTKKKESVRLGGFRVAEGTELLVDGLSTDMRRILVDGECEDRSSALVPVTRALLSAGAEVNEILTILTDPEYELSKCAYDHVHSGNRNSAAEWLYRYTVSRLVAEQDGSQFFTPVRGRKPVEKISEAEQQEQDEVVTAESWRTLLHRDKNGGIRADLLNIRLLLEHQLGKEVFRTDEFSRRIFYGADVPWGKKAGHPMVDADAYKVQHWLSEEFEINAGPQLVWAAITVVADKNSFHPIRAWLRSLDWDGTPRIDTWLRDYLGAEMPEPYLSEVSRKILLAAVARVFHPGIKFDHIVVLEGLQGIGKSTAVSDLAGNFFLGTLPNIRDKDALVALQGVWMVEISELATLRRVDVESYKAFFSSSVDKFRVPYGKGWEEFPRQCVFVGTTNHSDYLSDNTGNRRFWPVHVTRYQWGALRRDREQLFAEALVNWDNFHEELHLTGAAHDQGEVIQSGRVAESEESTMKDAFVTFAAEQERMSEKERFTLNRFRLPDLFETGGPWSGVRNRVGYHYQLAGRILRSLGYTRYMSHGVAKWRNTP